MTRIQNTPLTTLLTQAEPTKATQAAQTSQAASAVKLIEPPAQAPPIQSTTPNVLPHDGEKFSDYAQRIVKQEFQRVQAVNPDYVAVKEAKIGASAFAFFRGIPQLSYGYELSKGMTGPEILCAGDPHPENFGLVPSANGDVLFAPNDFDESMQAPVSVDLNRAATGFWLAAKERGESDKSAQKISKTFLKTYFKTIDKLHNNPSNISGGLNQKDLPDSLGRYFKEARKGQNDFLATFVSDNKEIIQNETFQPTNKAALLKPLIESHFNGKYQVLDIKVRLGAGNSSLGIDRYWAVVEDQRQELHVIELKESQPSALAPFLKHKDLRPPTHAERVESARYAMVPDGDPSFSSLNFSGKSFITRERCSRRSDIDMGTLNSNEFKDYTQAAATALAHAHAQSNPKAIKKIRKAFDKDAPKDLSERALKLGAKIQKAYSGFVANLR